ncbi:endothelin-2, partial [Stegastes partitus]|uniref:Endothelin-2 n=2 Tax=Stegastes partitus TaxID=144197 RepID=A0A9Y4K371_9TELE
QSTCCCSPDSTHRSSGTPFICLLLLFYNSELHPSSMMMASSMCRILTVLIVCMALQESCGLPLSDRSELPAQAPHPHRVRTKRCSCNSWDDKECIYFCHLDIIWVNTPSKLLPYGLGNPPSRRRRSANRCECLDSTDKTCRGFCRQSSEDPTIDTVDPSVQPARTSSKTLLASFRSAVKTNMAIIKGLLGSKKKPPS